MCCRNDHEEGWLIAQTRSGSLKRSPGQLLSLGWGVQLSLFSQPSLEGLKTPWESLWDMRCVSAYIKPRLWELPAGSSVTRQTGTELRPSLPWVLYLGAGSILDQGTNKGFKQSTPCSSMFPWGLKGMRWGLHCFPRVISAIWQGADLSPQAVLLGVPCPSACPSGTCTD